ncbi:MAG: threonine/serine exporter family protein [Eubacteriales bacterium]|nr:threonine/serine exporter family protein [Eubacteriales bacterium]
MNYSRLLQKILDIGEEMLVCGGEVSRVEDSILRMCGSYGYQRINVFIITSNIQVTMETPEGEIITQIRRIVRYRTNFDRLDYLNDLSRYICAKNPDCDEIKIKFYQVMDRKKQSKWLEFLGAVMISSGFAIFFGGNIMDGIAAAIMGIVITFMEHFLRKREKNEIVYFFVTSVVAGVVAVFTVKFGLGVNLDKIMIGGIMLLIPGIAMTNAIRDMLIGDTVSGLLRLVNSIILAATIASGFALAIIALGGML